MVQPLPISGLRAREMTETGASGSRPRPDLQWGEQYYTITIIYFLYYIMYMILDYIILYYTMNFLILHYLRLYYIKSSKGTLAFHDDRRSGEGVVNSFEP